MTQPARPTVGSSPLAHMILLAAAPERILALRLAMSSAIGPSSVVLDAGCGSLGVLAIMAARPGDTAIGGGWGDAIPLTIE